MNTIGHNTEPLSLTTALSTAQVEQAARALQEGALIALPTETVYGLAADASNDHAVAAIFAAKKRPQFNPLIVHVANLAMAQDYGVFSPLAMLLAQRFWPGPLTIVVPRKETAGRRPLSLLASAGLDTIGLRVPAHPVARDILTASGLPLAAPSANPSGSVSPTTADHVREVLQKDIAVIVDGGPCPVGIESTIIQVRNEEITLLRPGGISPEALEDAVQRPLTALQTDGHIIAPGMLRSHYATNAPILLNTNTPAPDQAFLAFGPTKDLPPNSLNLSPAGDLASAAANLFAYMRQLDTLCAKHQLTAIAIAPIPHEGVGLAINDRLTRAAAPRE